MSAMLRENHAVFLGKKYRFLRGGGINIRFRPKYRPLFASFPAPLVSHWSLPLTGRVRSLKKRIGKKKKNLFSTTMCGGDRHSSHFYIYIGLGRGRGYTVQCAYFSVVDPDPHWFWSAGSGSGSGRGKVTHKNWKKRRKRWSKLWIRICIETIVPDPWHFCVDRDPDLRIFAFD